MDLIGVVTLLLTERKSRLLLGLVRKKQILGIKSEDKLDGVSSDNKRTEETARKLEPD